MLVGESRRGYDGGCDGGGGCGGGAVHDDSSGGGDVGGYNGGCDVAVGVHETLFPYALGLGCHTHSRSVDGCVVMTY